MPADKKQNEQIDLFSLKVKQKLEDHRLPVDVECWEQIEAKVSAPPRRPVRQIAGWASAVAAVLVVLLVIRLYQPGPAPVPALDAGSHENGLIVERTNPEKMEMEKGQPDKAGSFAIPRLTRDRGVAHLPQEVVPMPILVDTVELPAQAEIVRPAAKAPAPRHRGPEPERRPASHLIARADKPKGKGGKWMVGATMGTGGHLSFDLLDNADLVPDNDMSSEDPEPGFPHPPIEEKPELDLGKKPESFTDIDCAPPLSFGFTVRKNLNDRVALESGLVYTYLYSKMHQSGRASYRASLGLHYLGIPLNLVVKLWDHPNWSLYLSGGVMMEKGLTSVYRLEAFTPEERRAATTRSAIDGLQWSLNLSVGVSYRLYRDWSLYLEPRYSYYFDNRQPVSYRTENMTLIGVGAGVRFEF